MKFELNQKKKFGVERIFRLKDKYTLLVIIKNAKERKEYLLDLMALDPESKRQTIFAFKFLILFFVLLSASVVLYIISSMDIINIPNQTWLLTGLGTLMVFSFILFITLSRREFILVSRQSKTPLVYFYNNFPNKKEFKLFTQYIKNEGQLRFEKAKLNEQQLRAGEMRSIRRVYDEGVLSNREYEKAKAKLLKLSN